MCACVSFCNFSRNLQKKHISRKCKTKTKSLFLNQNKSSQKASHFQSLLFITKRRQTQKVAYSADRFLASIPILNLNSEKFLLLFVLKGFIDYLGKFFPMKNNNKCPNKRNITCYDVTKISQFLRLLSFGNEKYALMYMNIFLKEIEERKSML